MHVVGIDPGNATGIAVLSNGSFDSFELPAAKVMPWFRTWIKTLVDSGVEPSDIHVGVEQCMIGSKTHKKSSQPVALQLTEHLRTVSALMGVWFRTYNASFTKTYRDVTLRRIGMLKPAAQDHANDGARVMLCVLLVDNKHLLYKLLEGGVACLRST